MRRTLKENLPDAGVTPLIDADGRPILTPLPKEE